MKKLSIGVSLPMDLVARLDDLSKKWGKPRNYVIEKGLENYLKAREIVESEAAATSRSLRGEPC